MDLCVRLRPNKIGKIKAVRQNYYWFQYISSVRLCQQVFTVETGDGSQGDRERWYKFRLNKNSRIRIWQLGPEPIIYKGNKKISFVHGTMLPKGYTFVSKEKLKEGAYYVLIKGKWNRKDRKNYLGCAYTFRWNYK